jgi:hypothetical protein
LLNPVVVNPCLKVPAQLRVVVAPPAVAYAVIVTSAQSTAAVAVPVLKFVHLAVSAIVPFVPTRIAKVEAAVPAAVLLIVIFQVIKVPF